MRMTIKIEAHNAAEVAEIAKALAGLKVDNLPQPKEYTSKWMKVDSPLSDGIVGRGPLAPKAERVEQAADAEASDDADEGVDQPAEDGKPKRKRRTKAEIEAASR